MKKALLAAGVLCATAFGVEPANLLAARSYLLFKAGHDRQAVALAKKACKEKDVIGCREIGAFYSKIYRSHKSNAYIMASTIYNSLVAEKKGCELHDPLACKTYAETIQSFINNGLIAKIPQLVKGYQNPAIEGMLFGQCTDYYGEHACREKTSHLISHAVPLYNSIRDPDYDKKIINYDLKLVCYYAKKGFPKIKPLPSSATKKEKDAYDYLVNVGKEKMKELVYRDGKCL